jgi:uncharacterized LabA/DUF88 family protein
MLISPGERLGLFIDGADLQVASRALGFSVDFKLLLSVFRQQGRVVRALYYTTLTDDEGPSVRPLVDWLEYNGYTTITRQAKCFKDQARRQAKSRIDVELAVDAMRLGGSLDHVVLFSGNSEFRVLVAALQEQGKRVTVVSTFATKPAIVADELRRQADQFVDLVDLEGQIRLVDTRPARASNI